ncbi:tetraacyldisaccharide 4'-kinase [Filimonas sp.]|nr:tetraacyldisaccharide 4'-kinase [Filimonas sp.]
MKSLILSLLRYISLPLALLYGIVVAIRNKFYDSGFFSSIEFHYLLFVSVISQWEERVKARISNT